MMEIQWDNKIEVTHTASNTTLILYKLELLLFAEDWQVQNILFYAEQDPREAEFPL